jgi:hypothetical protein
MDISSQQRVDDLPHRQHDPAQQHQALAQRERASLDRLLISGSEEQAVLELLDLLVQGLHRGEVSVDDEVQQAMHEKSHAVPGEVAVRVPASTTASMSNVSSLRTVTSACCVRNAATSLIASSAVTGSNEIAYVERNE